MRLNKDAIDAHTKESLASWKNASLEDFCAMYAPDAIFVTPSGIVQGRSAILEKYKKKYADPAQRGTLNLEMLQFRGSVTASSGTMVSAVFKWTVVKDGVAVSGHSLITYGIHEGKVVILQDASMTTIQ